MQTQIILLGIFLSLLSACRVVPTSEASVQHDMVRIDEASGLTQSILHPALYWTHNDSRNIFDSQPTEPLLFAINAQGELQGELKLDGVKPYDWEAISHFRQHDQAYLLIADIGDNRARRSRGIRLHAVREPTAIASQMHAQPAWTLELHYPDGARDAEAMAVDAEENVIYILSKRDNPPQLYRAKLPKNGANKQTLTLLGQIPPLNAELESSTADEFRVLPFTHQPVDMAFAPNRQEVALLTYSHVYIFPRSPQQSWLQAMQSPSLAIPLPGARQYEGLSYSQDGQTLLVVRESGEYNRQAAVPVLQLKRPMN